jgi:hypothetical protein
LDSHIKLAISGAPKWKQQSQLAKYLGHSPFHAGSVALVVSPKTGHVSPTFHVVFDDQGAEELVLKYAY